MSEQHIITRLKSRVRSLKTRWVWLLLLSSVALSLVWQFCPLPDASARVAALPLQAIGIEGLEVELTSQEATSFGEATAVKRFYRVGKQCFHLLILDATKDRHAIHDPLYCFKGAGWEIASEADIPMLNGTASAVTLERLSDTAHAVYWFSNGQDHHASISKYWLQTTIRRASLGLSGDEPVLVILQSTGVNKPNWKRVMNRFRSLQKL